jgi:CO/xanthine dehydrogenase Mo-binding subunit
MTVFKERVPAIGTAMVRADAVAKVSGREKYAADLYGEDLLWAGVKRAGVPHARLRGVEVEAARRVPGVAAVLTARDVQGTNRQGVIRRDMPVLVDDRVRHAGDAVALVVAADKTALEAGLKAIALDLEKLPGVFDPALAPDAPPLHEDHLGGNVLLAGRVVTGDGEAALAQAEVTVEARFNLPPQEHAFLETQAGWAKVEADGRLIIVASTQTPWRDRTEVAQVLGLEANRVRIVAPYLGGGFGGKDGITVQSLLGLAALAVPGRPIKMWWGREESFVAGVKRHPARLHYRLGADRDGTLRALAAEIVYDTGPYDHLGGVVMTLGLEHAGGPYHIPNSCLETRAVYTNNPVGGAFRGFGVPQVAAAMEQTLDLLAEKLGLDPLALRRRNAVRRGGRTPAGVTLTGSTGLAACLDRLAEHALWTGRAAWKSAAGAHKRRGVGLAAVMHGLGYGPVVPDVANAKVELTAQGGWRVYCGVADMGQGNATTALQVAADLLGQDAARIELVLPDTDLTLPSGSSSASRTTYTFTAALIGAVDTLKKRLLARAGDLMFAASSDDLVLLPGLIRHLPTGREMPLDQLANLMDAAERVATHRFRAPVSGESPVDDPALRLHGFPHVVFSFGAHLAAVEVDELTGRVEVKRYLAVTDCGRLINPQLAEQQVQGAIAQGLGYALWEEFLVQDGRVMTPDLATYLIPGALDLPDLEVEFVETWEPTGPFGLKGVGEVGIDGPLPATANAVADACGVRVFSAPLTPERVLEALSRGREAGR